ncbi:hypothetical protein V6Z11_D13G023500 [Gossypium hirsutum]
MSLKPSNQCSSILSAPLSRLHPRLLLLTKLALFWVLRCRRYRHCWNPFCLQVLFGNPKVCHCDTAAPEYYIWSIQRLSKDDALKYTVNECKVELKPPYSAFG